LFVDPAAIPAAADVEKLGQALAASAESYELMASFAAYTGLRWGELAALTLDQVDQDTRVVAVDRKVIEIGGKLYLELPKGRKRRRTIYPRTTPAGNPTRKRSRPASRRPALSTRPGPPPGSGLPFSPRRLLAVVHFARRVLAPAYLAAGWGDPGGTGIWTWHSLRHVFCTTALFTWNIEPADISSLAGHASIRITLDMYIGTTAGPLDRARTATE
jgi:integrase